MLSAEQLREFEARGVVRLSGAVDAQRVGDLRARIQAHVADRNLAPTGSGPYLAVYPSLTAPVAKRYGFAELWGTTVLGALDELLGAGRWHVPRYAGQILALSWPQPEQPWQVPAKSWHLDYAAPGAAAELPGAQPFLCIDRVESRGGATLVAAGMPRLVDAIRRRKGPAWEGRSADVRKAAVREVPWFRELCSVRPGEDRIARFVEKPTPFEGSELQVLELTGEPGDVWLMHPWMLHTLSANCSERARMVLTERIRRTAD
jgi:hypothetical protein